MSTINQLRQKLEQQKGQKIRVENDLTNITVELKESIRLLYRHEEAKEIIRSVGQKTQEQLSFHISDITTLALEAIFADPYELKVEFVQRRNKTECDLLFVRNDSVINDPMEGIMKD